jgi:hypothetical protein
MDRLGVPPKTQTLDTPATNSWFNTATNRLNVYQGAVNPIAAEIPENQFIVFYNTALNEVRIWTNIAGVAKKSAAFT